jgi:iron complex outermembrane receptor protein
MRLFLYFCNIVAKASMKYFLFSFLFLIFYSFNLAGQSKDCNCFVGGKIKDADNKTGLIGAIVEIKSQNKYAISDINGNYKISNLCEGEVIMLVKILGYQTQELKINLTHETSQNINLKEEDLHLEEVNVSAKRIENLSNNSQTISKKELEKNAGNNLANTLMGVAGVNMIQTGSTIAKPVIQGMHSNRILTLNNGIRHEGQQWGNEHAPEIDPFVAKKITVIRGAQGVRYGSDAIGGVIIIESGDLNTTDSITTEVNQVFNSNGNQAVLSGIAQGGSKKWRSWAWRLQATGKKAGNLSTPDYKLANTGMQEFNFSAESTINTKKSKHNFFYSQFNSKIGIFSGAHIGNLTDLKEAIEREKPLEIYTPEKFTYGFDRPLQDIQHNLSKYKLDLTLADNQSLQWTLGHQYNFRSEIDALRGDRNTSQTFKINTFSKEIIFNHQPIFNLFTGFLGFNGLFQGNLSNNEITKPTRSTVLIPNYYNTTLGLFFMERWVKQKFELEIGGRYDLRFLKVFYVERLSTEIQKDEIFNDNFSGTISLNTYLTNQLSVNFTSSTAWKAPTVNELYSDGVHHGSASYEIGDKNLNIEKAFNNSLGLHRKNEVFSYQLNFYFNYIQNYIFLAPTGNSVLTIRGAFPEFAYSQTNASIMGLDVNSNLKINSNLSLLSQMALLRGQDLSRNQALIFMPANRLNNSLIINFKKLPEFTLKHQFVARQNHLPTKNIFSNIESNSKLSLINGDYAIAPPAYQLLDFQASQSFKFKNGLYLNTGFEIKNLLNVSYRDYLNRFRYFADDLGRSIILRTKFSF